MTKNKSFITLTGGQLGGRKLQGHRQAQAPRRNHHWRKQCCLGVSWNNDLLYFESLRSGKRDGRNKIIFDQLINKSSWNRVALGSVETMIYYILERLSSGKRGRHNKIIFDHIIKNYAANYILGWSIIWAKSQERLNTEFGQLKIESGGQ